MKIWILLISILNAWYQVHGSCETDFEDTCYNDADCVPIAEFYLEACAGVLNGSISSGNCSDACQYGLTSYLKYIYGNTDSQTISDYCTCDEQGCSDAQTRLVDLGCINTEILSDCPSVFQYQCEGIDNETCGPIGRNYLDSCQMILNGSMTTGDCPYRCQLGLTLYLDTVWPDVQSTMVADYCNCGDNCDPVGGYLEDMGCIDKNECGYVFNYVCGTDPDCQPIGETYLDACEYILNGSVNSGTCTDDCRWGLTAYLDYVYPDVDSQNPDDYCNCAADNEDCDSKGDTLMSMGCIDKNDCTYVNSKCLADTACAAIAEQYFTDCQQFISLNYTAGSLTECPAACDASLTAYLDYNYGIVAGQSVSDYCNCNGGDECTTIIGWYDELGCGEEDDTDPTGSPSGANSNYIIQISCILAIMKAIVM